MSRVTLPRWSPRPALPCRSREPKPLPRPACTWLTCDLTDYSWSLLASPREGRPSPWHAKPDRIRQILRFGRRDVSTFGRKTTNSNEVATLANYANSKNSYLLEKTDKQSLTNTNRDDRPWAR